MIPSRSSAHPVAMLLVLIGTGAPLAAVDDVPTQAIGVWAEAQLDSTFTLADIRQEWDQSERIEIGFRAGMPPERVGIPFIHAGLFYEDRDWEEGRQSIDYEAFGLAVGGGIEFRLLDRDGGRLALGVVPWGRIGLATQHVIVDDVLDADLEDVLHGSFSVGRLDGAAGIDLRLTLARRLVVELGAGAEYWKSANVVLVATNVGSAVGVSDSIDFDGHGTFARLGAAITF